MEMKHPSQTDRLVYLWRRYAYLLPGMLAGGFAGGFAYSASPDILFSALFGLGAFFIVHLIWSSLTALR